ncbi:cadherin-like domain-containing protein [Pseudomaricurvus albidus]|uniref:cadherin-like domain-containing protein n=1 Tax=Pseudomaricurvus albidus TaxID=2842452 RepID=UPI0034E28C61
MTVTDAAGATDTQDLTITVTGTNDGAVISGVDTGSITEDTLAGRTKTLYAGGQLTITDVDAGEAQFQPATAPGDQGYGSFSLLADGSWTYLADNSNPAIQKLAAHQQVTDSITVQSADGTQHIVTVTIIGTNDAPIISKTLTPVSINETDALNFRVPANAFTDIDGDHITLSATLADGSPLPSWLHFNPATQTFTGHPDHADDGSVSVRISAVDPSGAEAHQNFSLTVVDNVAPNAPTLNPLNPNNPGIPYIATGTPTFTGTAEPGSLISILDGTRVLGTVTADDKGHFTFQPTQPLTDGDHAFSITATDTAGNQSSASAPLPTTVDTQTRPELQIDSIDNSLEVHHDTTGSHPVHGANHPGHSAHWASNAVEVTSGDVTIHGVSTGVTDGSTVTVHLVDKLNNANTFDLTTTVTGGQWSVTVPHTQIDKVGTHDWQVEVSAADLFGNTVHTTTEIIDEDGLSKTLSENGAAANLDLLGDNDGIQVGQVLYSNDGVHFSSQLPAGVALDADGHTLQIDPANPAFDHLTPNDEAKVYVRYLLTETVGSASEHIFQSAVVTVTGSNDVPVVTATDVAHAADIGAIDEDSSKTFTTAELLNLVGASDADGDRLSISAVNIDSQYGGFTQQGDHWLFTPAANVHHDDIPITVQVSDGTAETEAHAILDLTSVTDAAQVSLDILAEQSVVNFSGTEAGSAEIKNIPNAQTLNALAVELTVVGDAQPAENGLMFALSTNDLQQVLNIGGFCVTKPQNLTILFGNGTTYETHINMNADPGSHRWSILWNGDSGTLDILKDGQPIWHGDNVEKGYSLEANDAVATMGNIAYRDDYFDPNNDWKGEIFDLSVATTLVNPAALANAPLRDVAHTSDLMLDVRVQGGQIVDSARHSPITLTGAVSTVEAMVDTHVIPPNPGALLHLSPTITTQDPYDQVTGIHIGGFAAGTVLDDGQGHHHTITGPTERVNISGWTLGGLTAQLPQGDTSNMRVTLNVETTGPDGTLALSDFSAAVILDPTAPVPDATVGGEDTKATDEDTAVSGDLTVSDADASQAHFTIQHDVDGNYGKFNVDADGHWSYAPDNRADHLAAGAHESETFTVTTTDGTTHEVVINLTGTDDPGRLIASTPHPADLAQPDKASGGVFKVVDIDNPNLSAIRQENTAGHYGTFKIGTGGVWFYQVDPTTPDSQQLGNGQTAQEHFTVEYSDGSQHTLTVDILGTSHGPTVISQEVNLGKMTEDTSHSFSETELLQMFGASTDAGADLHVTDITIDPQYGSFSHESDGSWTFHPAANVSGDHIPFTITVGDGTASTTGVGALAVTNIQDAPTVSITPLSTDEDTPYSFSAADFGFTDADAGDTLNHVTITGLPSVAEGQLLLDGSAVTANQQIDVADIPKLVFQPTADFNGDVAFKYTVNDGHADSAEATGNLSVQAVDDVVMVTATDGAHAADLGSTAEDTAKTFSEAQLLQLVGAHDVDGDTLHVSTVAVDAAAGTFAKNPDGSWTFTPTANFDVSHLPVTIEVTDGNGITPAYALMDISPVADTPTLDISLGGKIILTPVASLATEMGVSTGQTFLGSTFVDFNGFYDKPVLYGSAEDLAHVTAIKAGGETLHLGAEVHDPEHGTGREIVGNWNIRAFVDNSGDGSVKLVVDDTAPTQMTFSMHYTDGEEFVTDVADWADFTVDRTPTTGGSPSNNFSATIDEDTPLPLYLTVADPDTSEQLTITISGLPAGATLNAGTDNHDGSWTLSPEQLSGLQMTPAANWNGEINLAITVTSTDGSSHADTTSNLKIAVNPVEDLSTVSGEDLRDVTEGVNAGHHDLTVNVVEGYHNKFTGHTLAPVTLGDTATGQIFIPIGGLDSSGIQFQVAGFSDSLLVRYGHHFVNLGNPDYGFHGYAVVADNDKALSITASYSGLGAQSEIGGDLHIQDVDTPAATFVEVNGAAGDQGYGQFSMHNGHWTFVPGPNAEALPDGQKATETFTFHTSDGTEHQVVINLTGSDSESRFTGSLSGTIQSSAELTAQDQASGSLGIFDPDAGTTQPTLPDITSQAGDNGYGHFSLQDGHWTYTPDEAAVAPLTIHEHVQDSLTIHASDGREVVITVDITGSNSAPTVSGSVHLSNLGDESPVTITEAQLLSHASDIDLDANESLSVSGVTVDHGSITHHNDGTWTFTPEQGYTGSVQFSYQVEDQHHGVTHASAELTIVDNDLVPTVTATDSAHAADLGNTAEDTTMTFTEADLLSKVGAHDSDATDTLSISDITSPHGSFTKLATGDWEFTPEANYHGDDVAVSIQVSDGSLSTTAQAIIDITSVTDAPIISASVTGVSTITRQVETPVQSLVETATGTTDTPLDLSYLEASGTDGMLGNTVAFTVPSGVDNHCITGLLIDGQLVSGDPVYCGLYDSNNQDTVVFPDLDVATFMNARNITFQFADNAPAELDIKITYDWGAIGWSETETGLLMQEAGSLHIDRHGTVMEMRETEIMASPEDSPISLDIDVQAAAADDQLVSIVMTGIPDGATLSAGSHNADGSWTLAPADLAGLTLTPAQDWRGDIDLQIVAKTSDGTQEAEQSSTLSVTVAPVADVPTVTVSAVRNDEDSTFDLDIQLGGHFDAHESQSIEISGIPVGSSLSAGTSRADGVWVLTPQELPNLSLTLPKDYETSLTLDVKGVATDEGGVTGSQTVQMSVEVNPLEDAPDVRLTSTPEFNEDTSYTFQPSDFGFHDVDSADSLHHVTLTQLPASGVLLLNGQAVTTGQQIDAADIPHLVFQPTQDFQGQLSLGFTVNDGQLDSAESVMRLDVINVNDAATFTGDKTGSMTDDKDALATISGQLTVHDIDSDHRITVHSYTGVETYQGSNGWGSLKIDPDGNWEYTLNDHTMELPEGKVVTDSVTVHSVDGTPQVITVTITGTNQAPIAGATVHLPDETSGTPFTISEEALLATAHDVDLQAGEELSVHNLHAGFSSVTDNGDGTFTITPQSGYTGEIQISFEVHDPQGGVVQSLALLDILPSPTITDVASSSDTVASQSDTTALPEPPLHDYMQYASMDDSGLMESAPAEVAHLEDYLDLAGVAASDILQPVDVPMAPDIDGLDSTASDSLPGHQDAQDLIDSMPVDWSVDHYIDDSQHHGG